MRRAPPHQSTIGGELSLRSSDSRAGPPTADLPLIRLPMRSTHLHAPVAAVAAPSCAGVAAVTAPARIVAAPASTVRWLRLKAAAAIAACHKAYAGHTLARTWPVCKELLDSRQLATRETVLWSTGPRP